MISRRVGTISKVMFIAVILAGSAFIGNAWAGDSSWFTRQNWDMLMRWLNFIILAAVIYKYGRKPILQFLDSQKAKITSSIDELEEKRRQTQALVRESESQLADSQKRLAQLKDRIVAEGQNRKDQLISDAQNEARNMMVAAQSKIEGQMKAAHADIKSELVDMAADLALSKLPQIITTNDQNHWLDYWFSSSAA